MDGTVAPLRSWNPLWANLYYPVGIAKQALAAGAELLEEVPLISWPTPATALGEQPSAAQEAEALRTALRAQQKLAATKQRIAATKERAIMREPVARPRRRRRRPPCT